MIRVKLATNRVKTLYKSINEFSSIRMIGAINLRIAFVVCDASCKSLERISWPGKLIVWVKKLPFLSLSVASALYRREKTSLAW